MKGGYEKENDKFNSIIADASGALDSHAQFGIDSAIFYDEDIEHILNSISAPANIDVLYKDGAAGNWRYKVADNFPVIPFSGGSNLLAWNVFTGGAWQQTEIVNGRYVLCHVWLIDGLTKKVVAIQGEAEYITQVAAREGALIEIADLILAGLPVLEMIPIASVIYQTSTTYTNAVQARIRKTDTGDDYVDFRDKEITSASAPTNHNNLAGRGDASAHPPEAIVLTPGDFSGVLNALTDAKAALIALDNDIKNINLTLGDGSLSTGLQGDFIIKTGTGFKYVIQEWTVSASDGTTSGSIRVDIWGKAYVKDTPPTVANTITGTDKPRLVTEQSKRSSALTGWTTDIVNDTHWRINVDSVTTIVKATVHIEVKKVKV